MVDLNAGQPTGVSGESVSITASFACAAETAECSCPDACERDHGND
jgi:hypothetical protein